MRGVIEKCLGGFYYVRSDSLHECRAAGRFRNEDIKPLPGDIVDFSPQNGGELGYIEDVLPRKNELIRPAVANVDMLMVVVSAGTPKCDYKLADKLIACAKYKRIPCVLVINKCDEADAELISRAYRHSGADILVTSALTGRGLSELKEKMRGKLTALAGQSAVGKSSLINSICPGLNIKTGGLSKKTARGKHTTRASEIIAIEELNGFIVDTPGFSVFDGVEVDPTELGKLYEEFTSCPPCRFLSCVHENEPDCEVKARVQSGLINRGRYERYLEQLNDLRKRKENKYD